MSYLEKIYDANKHDLRDFLRFQVGSRRVGLVHRNRSQLLLQQWSDVFEISRGAGNAGGNEVLQLSAELCRDDYPVTQRTKLFAAIADSLRQQGYLGTHWWNEMYAVTPQFHQPASFLLERAAVPFFGVTGFGVHINGYVRDGDRFLMWIARRALDRPSAPGKLDQIVAGGQPAGLSLKENLVKECAEEAAIPAELAAKARPGGAVSYCLQTAGGIRPDVLYVYDLELPADFKPENTDGEVDAFYLLPFEDVCSLVHDTDQFKFNCALVVIDFMIRQGVIQPQEPDYLTLLAGLLKREAVLARFDGN